MKTLQTAPLSDMNESQQDLLAMTNTGPVVLLQEDQVAGVLLSPAQWEAITKTLEAVQECLTALDAAVYTNPER
ncbi:MAG: hypothetical protein R2932_06360 [Caldilineaceae bacterium]